MQGRISGRIVTPGKDGINFIVVVNEISRNWNKIKRSLVNSRRNLHKQIADKREE